MDLTYLKEDGYNLELLGSFLSTITEPLSVSASLYDDELTEGFKRVDSNWTQYQVLYLALSKFKYFVSNNFH